MLKRKKFRPKMIGFLMTMVCFLSMEPAVCQEKKMELPEYLTSEWAENNLKKWVSSLKSDKTTLPEQEAAFKKALHSSNLPMAETIANGMLALNSSSEEGLLRFLRNIILIVQKQPDYFDYNYEGKNRFPLIAAKLYLATKNPHNEAFALFILASQEGNESIYLQFMHEANKKMPIKELRKAFPELVGYFSFAFKEKTVMREGRQPKIRLQFSHPLPKGLNPQQFFDIRPKVEGVFFTHDRHIDVTGVEYGQSYSIRLKQGLPSHFGEMITQDSDIHVIVDERNPSLSLPSSTYIVNKNDELLLPLTAVNVKRVKIRLYRVNPESIVEAFRPGRESFGGSPYVRDNHLTTRYGEFIAEDLMDMGEDRNNSITKQIPLSKLIVNPKPGVYAVLVEKDSKIDQSTYASQWIFITDIGMSVFKGGKELSVCLRSLETAQELPNISVQLIARNNTVLADKKTTDDGWVHFDKALLAGKGGDAPRYIVAKGSDGSYTVQEYNEPAFDLSDRGSGGRKTPGKKDAYLYSERGMYRPGESIHVNALLRNDKSKAIAGEELTFQLLRPDQKEVSRIKVHGNDLGFYNIDFPLTSSARIGKWTVKAYTDPNLPPIGEFSVTVEDFVPSRLLFLISSEEKKLKPEAPTTLQLQAKFLYGAAAANLQGSARLIVRPDPNPFPGHPGYLFGLRDDTFTNKQSDLSFKELDDKGMATIPVSLDATIQSSLPLQALIKAEVVDIGGRARHSSYTIPVHLRKNHIGIACSSASKAFPLDAIKGKFSVISLNEKGELKPATLEGKLFREEIYYDWSTTDNQGWGYHPIREDHFVKDLHIQTGDKEPSSLEVPLEEWGYYRLELRDPETGAATSFRFTKGYISTEQESQTPDQLTLTLNKDKFANGDIVQVQFQAPFDGTAILVVANEDILHKETIQIKKGDSSFNIAANKDWGAGAYVLVSAFRPLKPQKIPAAQSLTQRLLPKRAVGLSWIQMDPKPKTLNVALTLPKEVKPRQSLSIPIKISGDQTKNTMISLAAVDEGILMLTDFVSPKPQNYFLAKRMLGLEMRDIYGKILNPEPGDIGLIRSGGDSGALDRNLAALSKRSFRIVSLYNAPIYPDEAGNASVTIQLPDFNGTLRLMAIAHNQESVGSGEASLLVRDPIVLEGILPRFLAPGDQAWMTVSAHNTLKEAKDVTVSIAAEGAVSVVSEPIQTSLKPHGDMEQKILLKGLQEGEGRIHMTLSSPNMEPITRTFEINCRPMSAPVSRTESSYLMPGDGIVVKPSAYQDLTLSSRQLSLMISDQFAWDMSSVAKQLINYPYGCVEQTASRAFGLLYEKHRLTHPALATTKDTLTPEEINRQLAKALAELVDKQLPSGAFSLWGSGKNDIWLSAYVYDLLTQLVAQNIAVPVDVLQSLQTILGDYVKQNNSIDLTTAAYAILLLTRDEAIEKETVSHFYDTHFKDIPFVIGRVFVASALALHGDRARYPEALNQLVPENAQEHRPGEVPYGSEIRNQAAIVWALTEAAKKRPECAALAHRSLMSLRDLYRMNSVLSTQENAWLIRAGLSTPSVRQTDTPTVQIQGATQPLSTTFQKNFGGDDLKVPFSISNTGVVPLWVASTTSGVPEKPQDAVSSGLVISRQYYTLDGKALNINGADIKQGAQFVVVNSVALSGKDEMFTHCVLLNDLLPAGFEIENEALPASPQNTYPWSQLPPPMVNQRRDDRNVSVVLLTTENPSAKIAYRVRAITPGKFGHPGLFAEDMYKPIFFARTAPGSLHIKKPESK